MKNEKVYQKEQKHVWQQSCTTEEKSLKLYQHCIRPNPLNWIFSCSLFKSILRLTYCIKILLQRYGMRNGKVFTKKQTTLATGVKNYWMK